MRPWNFQHAQKAISCGVKSFPLELNDLAEDAKFYELSLASSRDVRAGVGDVEKEEAQGWYSL